MRVKGTEIGYEDKVFLVLKPYPYKVMGLRFVKATVGVESQMYHHHNDTLDVGMVLSLYGLNTIAQDNMVPEYQLFLDKGRYGKKSDSRFVEEFAERLIAEGVLQLVI